MMKRRPVSHCHSPAAREREMSQATGERVLTLSDGWSAVDAVPHGKSTRFSRRETSSRHHCQCIFQGLERQKQALYDQGRPGAVTAAADEDGGCLSTKETLPSQCSAATGWNTSMPQPHQCMHTYASTDVEMQMVGRSQGSACHQRKGEG